MPIKNIFKAGIAGAAFLAFSAAGAFAAPDIPCGTAKLIVPWGAGGGTDIIFRQIVEKVNKNGAKPQLQVVNVGGQGGNKGAKQAAKANANAYTNLFNEDDCCEMEDAQDYNPFESVIDHLDNNFLDIDDKQQALDEAYKLRKLKFKKGSKS